MVKTTTRTGRAFAALSLLAAAALSVSGCKMVTAILSWSLFPSFLSGVEATRDLSRELEDLAPEGITDWGLDIAALRGPFTIRDYVFLHVGTPLGSRLLVLDSDLDVINTVSGEPTGGRALVDADGRFVLGKVQLVDPPVGPPLRTDIPGDGFPFGFSYGATWNYCFRQRDPNTLEYMRYGLAWGGGTSVQPQIDSDGGSWNLVGAGCVASRPTAEVMIAAWRWDKRLLAVVFVDQAVFAGAFAGPFVNTCCDPPTTGVGSGFFLTLDEEEPKRVHYTAKGVLVRTQDREARLYDFSGAERLRIQFGDSEIEDSYTEDGEWFYHFDRDQRLLFKGRTGW